MLTDRYGVGVSTASAAARDAYVEACDLMLTLYPGAVAAFDRAIAADPDFALAHVGRARALQLDSDVPAALGSLAAAKELTSGLPAREISHIEVFSRIFSGQSDAALALVREHLDTWPRDAMVLSTASNQNGLIGFSGRAGREQELVEFLDGLASHYGDDWWFNAHYAMALSETSQQDAARPKIEQSIAQNPRNAYAAHSLAHLHYEAGERDAAVAFMQSWLPNYPRNGLLYGHLSWHVALFELQAGNLDEGFRLYDAAFASGDYPGPGLLKLVDASSFLWRSELAGHPRDHARWRAIRDLAVRLFPHSGMPIADWHVALAEAVAGDTEAVDTRVREMEELVHAGSYPAGPIVPALARGFAAFQRQDFAATIEAIAPMLTERERIGGSRAQIDLVEFTLLKAYLGAGRLADARRLLSERRPGPARIPVAGLELVH